LAKKNNSFNLEVANFDGWLPLKPTIKRAGVVSSQEPFFVVIVNYGADANFGIALYLPRRKVRWLAIWLHNQEMDPCMLIVGAVS